jgi:hypothetical protein
VCGRVSFAHVQKSCAAHRAEEEAFSNADRAQESALSAQTHVSLT